MATMTPVQFTNGIDTRLAETPSEVTQFRWEGWWALGEVEPPLQLSERFVFGPTRPSSVRVGTVYIATPV